MGAALFSSGGDSWFWASWGGGPIASGSVSHASPPLAGEHRHYFQGGSPNLTVYSGYFLIQYVYIPSTTPPREIMLEFRDTSGSWAHRAYWGADLIDRGVNGTASRRPMGPLPAARDSWIMLEVRAEEVGVNGLTVDGVSYTLYDGGVYWDFTALQYPYSGNTITVAGLVPSQKVEVYDSNWVMKNSTVVPAGQSAASLYLYDNGIKVFPFKGFLKVYAAGGSLQYITPLMVGIWPQDLYHYSQPVFSNTFQFQPPNVAIHSALMGQANYQNQTSTPQESYAAYNQAGDIVKKISMHNLIPLNTTYAYDSYGNALSATNPKGQTTGYTYSSVYQNAYLTNVTQTLSPGVDIVTSYEYDFPSGNQKAITDPRGNRTDYQYDAIGRRTLIQHPAVNGVRSEVRTFYLDAQNKIDIRNEKGNYTRVTYDGLGRKTMVQRFSGDPSSNVLSAESYLYNWQGKVRRYTAPDGNATTYTYDYLGRQLTVTNPDLTTRSTSYDDVNSVNSRLDENNHRTSYLYDILGRLAAVREYYDSTNYYITSYSYDAVGNLVKTTDAKNQVTTYTYDDLNRLTVTRYPDGFNQTRTYDNIGNLASKRDPNGNNVTYTYDAVNRLTTINYPGGSQATFSYDKNGNRVDMSNGNSSTVFAYDARNRETSETWTIAGSPYTLAYGYDSVGNMVSIAYPEGTVARFSVDALNRVTEAKKGSASLATFTYAANLKPGSISYDNGVVTSYTYDSRGRPLKIKTVKNQNVLLDLNYGYDSNGNVRTITNLAGGSSTEYYSYDYLNRLTNSTGPWAAQPGLLYGYDAVGNRAWMKEGTGANTTYTYGLYNRLVSVGSTAYTYHNNGNTKTQTTGSVTTSFYYDFENRLTKVTKNFSTLGTYAYSPGGVRILSIESGTTTVSLSLGTSVVYEKQGSTQNLYVVANGLLVARLNGNNKFFHHQDHLGNTRLVTKGSQTEFSSNYKPFGPQHGASGTDPVYKYTGKPKSAAVGLYYYGARWYNESLGRFLTRDPNPGRLSNPQSLNLYVYVLNNPLRYVDPTGKAECGWNPLSWGGCAQNAGQAVVSGVTTIAKTVDDAWNSLSPEQQQLITLAAIVVVTAATGGTALLAVGAIGFALGAGAYTGVTLATGGTPTLQGALKWGTLGFTAATAVASLPTIGPRVMSTLGLRGANVARTAAQGIYDIGPGVRIMPKAPPGSVVRAFNEGGELSNVGLYDNAGLLVERIDILGRAHNVGLPHVVEYTWSAYEGGLGHAVSSARLANAWEREIIEFLSLI